MEISIYHYEPYYKFYIKQEVIKDRRPSIGLPANSTDIKPPFEHLSEGMIPVFNGADWDIVQDNFWRPVWKEINYDSGRGTSTYKPIALSLFSKHFPEYPSMPMLCNSMLVSGAIIQRVRHIQEKFESIILIHRRVCSGEVSISDSPNYEALVTSTSLLFQYKLELETIIYFMRRVLDSLVQLSYLLTNFEEFERSKTILDNEIGRFIGKQVAETNIEKIIIGDGQYYSKDDTGFFEVINSLFNSFKHCLMHDESYHHLSLETPSVVSYHARHNNHQNEIIYHNHNAYHIMMGFQDNVLRILSNQKIYQMRGF